MPHAADPSDPIDPIDPSDPFDLERFVGAQAPVYETALAELAAGAKRSHWMWFVFPQLRGLGRSATAQRYGIGSLAEARAYARHPLLGARLVQCARRLAALRGIGAPQIFGPVDAQKLRSCLTLFEAAAPEQTLWAQLLGQYFGGQRDAATLALLRAAPPDVAGG